MDKLLKDDSKQKCAVIIKNVDSLISALSQEEIVKCIDKDLKVKRVVEIPNGNHLMKIIFSELPSC